MKTSWLCPLFALLVIFLSACSGSGPSSTRIPATGVPTSPTQDQISPTDTGVVSGRDLSTVMVCELVTAEEVAALAGGSVSRPPTGGNDAGLAGCTYEIDPPGEETYHYYIVYVMPPEFAAVTIDLMAPGEYESLSGLDGQAFIKFEDVEQQFRLLLLRPQDYAIEIIGSTREVILKLAETLIARMR